MHDEKNDVAQHGGHTPANGTCGLGLHCVSLILDIHLWSTGTCQNKVSTDQYHVTILQAQVLSSLRSHVFFEVNH